MSEFSNPAIVSAALAAIMENTVDAIITIDPRGLIVSGNPATELLFGYKVGELIGKNIQSLMTGPDADETSSHSFFGGDREVIGKRKDGSTFPVHLAVTEIEIDGQKLYAGIVRDISDFNERQARLEAILENAVDAIITIDERGLIDSANPATERLFGFKVDELIGQNVKILMPDPYRAEHDGYLNNYLATGKKKIIGIGREVVGQRKDGSTFPMHLAVSEIRVGDRKLFTGIVRDITDLKAAEQELAAINEKLEDRVKQRTAELKEAQADLLRSEKFATLGKVSGGIAHEIRNPLNAVKTSAYFLLNAKTPTSEKIKEHLERIDRQVTLIDNVVTALSDVAKLPDAELVVTDIRPLLSSAMSAVSMPASINSKTDLPESLPNVMVDANQIVIAFKNLIRNARDAMPDGGEISITATINDQDVAFHVCDTGTGIEPEIIDQIMEPLFTTKARGMGLGLSITRTIVEKNKGTITVESELGNGSCFTIELKRAGEAYEK